MSSGVETLEIVDTWLWSVLSTDAVLEELIADRLGYELGFTMPTIPDSDTGMGDLPDLGPDGMVRDYLTWNMTSNRDVVGNAGQRIYTSAYYTVKAVTMSSSYSPLLPVTKRVDQLLHGAFVDTDAGSLSCTRERIVQYVELPSSLLATRSGQFRHLGATYRFLVNSHS